MSIYGEQLLSKIVDTGNLQQVNKYNVKRSDFSTEAERTAFDFITKYATDNGGETPSYVTYVANCQDITYLPGVTDSFDYLIRELKDKAGKIEFAKLIERELDDKYNELSTVELTNWLTGRLTQLKMGTQVRNLLATDVKKDFGNFLHEYEARKAGTSFRIWSSAFSYINDQIGGFMSSNMYTWYARSGRGKSIIVMVEALEAAIQGATVLIWALEMSSYEWMARAYSYLSAKAGIFNANVDGTDYEAGFDNKAMLMGRLTDENETLLEDFLRQLNDNVKGRIILRAVDDEDFRDKSTAQLEVEIADYEADVVVVDPIYYMDYEQNTSKTAGGDAAATSKKLRLLAGRTKTVIHVITQADENPSEKGEDGVREMKPPKRAEIKKTKAVLEDAANTFGIDTLSEEGRGIIELGKGRSGGEDARVEIVYLPNFGIVQEINTQGQADMFTLAM